MNERDVLEQRLATLLGLLSAPAGPLGPNAGALGEQLRAAWETEARLIERLLAETPGADVLATVRAWRSRTLAFAERSPVEAPTWTDKQGRVWNAPDVLMTLDDLTDRVERWMRAAGSDGGQEIDR